MGKRCIFCKTASHNSRSREHIIPESLGNLNHVLPPGTVCDACNNYFSREVEKPFMALPGISILRSNEGLPSKKGKIPATSATLNGRYPAQVRRQLKGPEKAVVDVPSEAFQDLLSNSGNGILIVPMEGPIPDGPEVSRFIAKVAVEFMAQRLLEKSELIEGFIDDSALDQLRMHARSGQPKEWPVHRRRIYEASTQWAFEGGNSTQIVYESDFIFLDESSLFFVLALFGMEYAINCGEREVSKYESWLAAHGDVSPLYFGKNKELKGFPTKS